MTNGLVKYNDVVKLIRETGRELLDECEWHYDEELQDKVYINAKEVDMILGYNKRLREKLKALEMEPGEWVHYNNTWRCSVCEKYVYGAYTEIYSGEYRFCPYCGTRMEENDG